MYFKDPELLYALIFLLVPILVHLFQLRKFRTTKFTNLKFLKKAVLQTRKSSRLKKFLILTTRLLMIACLVLAFAQPYFPSESGEVEEVQTVIYLDNSYSMQARGKNGVLLRRSIQDLLENLPAGETVSLFTNEDEFRDITPGALREKLHNKEYSSQELSWREISLKAGSLFRSPTGTAKIFIAVSDFQNSDDSITGLKGDVQTHLVRLQPENYNNVSLDSTWISSNSMDETVLSLSFSGTGEPQKSISIGLYAENRLLARKTVDLGEDLKGITTFSLSAGPIPAGILEVEDNGLQFDNRLYFSINETPPVRVVVIGDNETDYLQRIYRTPEFDLKIFPENNIDYNMLSQANLVILNEPENIPFSMVSILQQLVDEQVYLVIIPGMESSPEEYYLLLRNLNLPVFGALNENETLITDISFDHPLYRNVFDEKVRNFEYPRVQSYFPMTGTSSGVLRFQSGQPFLLEQENIFVFTAPLNSSNSNFKNAPLIVPTFYNIGNLAISRPEVYYLLGERQEIAIQANLQKDEILKLSSSITTFIPQQQNSQNKVSLVLGELPRTPGHYDVLNDSTRLRTLSFNVDRSESKPVSAKIGEQENVFLHNSIPDVFNDIKSAREVESLWKWFVIFTLFFLLIEMLILKFLK